MKHAKRMVLVPEDTINKFEQRQRLETSPIMANMMQKDTLMSNILQRTDMNDAEKQKLYNANMERYLELRHQMDNQIPTGRFAPSEEPEEKIHLSDEVIVENIPKTMRSRAIGLLNRLKARPDAVSWDDTGQVKIEGVTIPQSNISDLVSDAMRARKNFNPKGSKEFFRALSKINIPKDYVRNTERWKHVGSSGEEEAHTPATTSKYFKSIVKRREDAGTITPKRWTKY